MKYLVVLRHPLFLKNVTPGLGRLIARGHQVRLVFSEPPRGRVGEELIAQAREMLPALEIGHAPSARNARSGAASIVATALDALRYDLDMYRNSRFLRQRALTMVTLAPGANVFLRLARRDAEKRGYQAAHDALMGVLDSLPAPRHLVEFLKSAQPDVMIVSPLTPFGSEQAAFILAARACGIPTLYSMYSWDNLTNKGMLRPLPDYGLVWNESHRREAAELHGLAAERTVLTGAPGFDAWFEPQPAGERAAFCAAVGLDPAVPFILYTCSSVAIGGRGEAGFVESWLAAIRASGDERLARLGVLVRPHPQNAAIWNAIDLSRFGNVAVYPRAGAIPFAGGARQDFFLSIHHALAVVGINTSAMIESAIVNRPIIAFEDPTFGEGHLGTLHYCELLKHDFMIRTPDLASNIAVLRRLAGGDREMLERSRAANARFIDYFIRPLGRGRPAAECWAEAVEQVSARAVAEQGAGRRPGGGGAAPRLAIGFALVAGWLYSVVVQPAEDLMFKYVWRRSPRDIAANVLRGLGLRPTTEAGQDVDNRPG
ncbi:hypothetical protein [Blastochloris tepida]|uniref:Uncharacterized protein n=1 Tax=Blastochloris tepida TaxID=2233851 RepID=A0A348FVL7_9HYPH|nr:hypothetical protein [Blastochloris tepida]BBF91350.1 hypothetical protein BLTE_00350 [Blastochloris tepida]